MSTFTAQDAKSVNDETSDPNLSSAVQGRSIGDIIRDARSLSAAEVEKVLVYQRANGVRS